MECLALLCLYLDVAAGMQESDPNNYFVEDGRQFQLVEYVDGRYLAKAAAGVQVRDWFYMEVEHISNPNDPHDYGVNAVWVGKRWTFGEVQ